MGRLDAGLRTGSALPVYPADESDRLSRARHLRGLIGLLYPKTLYGLRDLFHRVRVPNHMKPAIGGLLVGLIGLFLPQALGMGYGFAQFAVNGDYLHL
ncbi:MAG TPA: chloride channel protein, partial [Ktedonobacterales bacterium]|nr:chloride channel protein [Ktedonobacterales bacterium]